MTPILEIKNLSIERGKSQVLLIDHLELLEKELLAVIGPNGAGKSTLLLAISQLVKITRGEIKFCGQIVDADHALSFRRRIGLVMQDPLLMDISVFDNVATGLRFRAVGRVEVKERVDYWLERLGVIALRQRPARSLSGGEAQRVSLARAFALDPELLLLDEPFSALDAPTRARLLDDFHSLISQTQFTTVLVTHALDEALLLGSRVAVLINGELRQIGSPEDIFNTPSDPDIAAFVGVETVVRGRVIQTKEGLVTVESGAFHFEAAGNAAAGREVLLCLRPEDIILMKDFPASLTSARNRLHGRVVKISPQGPLVRVVVDCGFPLVALITRSSSADLALEAGVEVAALFKVSAVHLIER
jgi:molybdopterin-binding protein